ncbi:TPA: hypothetical protein N0F65_002022 [Lagenidium giganteum]|uniref:Uncharacterized protein n=1 Tax=Lagenidium giganteum TaxID=4803 RepID=A0AAV2Z366_9STRA|nr:TPA: hypothetical protein N0F65_002022 [Lagenidium giganteum]
MGACFSRQQWREDERFMQTGEFVRYAVQGDIANIRQMVRKEKLHPDSQDLFMSRAVAAYMGKLTSVQELLNCGATVAKVDHNGRNALHHACRKDQDDVVRFLIMEAKMDINSQSENKDTPLHKAVRGKSVKSIELLLQLGADPHLRNDQNRTPLEELDSSPSTAAVTSLATYRPRACNWFSDDAVLSFMQDEVAEEINTAVVRQVIKPRRHTTPNLSAPPPGTGNSANSIRGGESTHIHDFHNRLSECTESAVSERSSRANSARMLGSSSNITFVKPMTPKTSSNSDDRSDDGWSQASEKVNRPLTQNAFKNKAMVRKSLKYAGKRVIAVLRVKKQLSGEEKKQMIRLLLEKYSKRDENPNGRTPGNGLEHQPTLVTLLMPTTDQLA